MAAFDPLRLLETLVNHDVEFIVTDVEGRDRYGRLLRYVWRPDGLLVNRALVRRGMARARLYPRNDGPWDDDSPSGAQAQRDGAGLWQQCAWKDDDGAVPPPSNGTTGCDPNYTGCVPPYPPDVDCTRVSSAPHGPARGEPVPR